MLKFQTVIRVNHNQENPFVQLSKTTLWDDRLSLKAVGLWSRCMSRPDDWRFNISELSARCKEGRWAVESAMQELIAVGLVCKFECKTRTNGKFTGSVVQYMIFEHPVSEEDRLKYEEEFKKCFRDCSFRDVGCRDVGNHKLPKTETQTENEVSQVNEAATPTTSMPRSISNGKRSLFSPSKKKPYMGKAKYNEEQRAVLEWLKGLNIDTDDATLSWWARNYGLQRLLEVHRSALKRKARSVGAYMNKLLKTQANVPSDRVEENRAFAEEYKAIHSWHELTIFEKYGKVQPFDVEISFDMAPLDFIEYLMSKHECQR